MTGCEIALLALTMNIYMEARGESITGRHAVMDTTLTRVIEKHQGDDNVVDVVLRPYQFSWTKKHKVKNAFDLMTLQNKILHSKQTRPGDIVSYRMAEAMARKGLKENYKRVFKFRYFNTVTIDPQLKRNEGKDGYRIGNHIFYRY